VKKILLQSYDKVSINSSAYNFSIAAKCVTNFIYSIIPYQPAFFIVPSHRKNHINFFVLNHRLIKKGVNKQIKLFSLSNGGASH